MFLHHVEEAEDVAHAGQRHALLSREVLDDLHLADVPLRVAAPIRRRAMRLDEVRVLIKHQGAWMCLQDLGRDADRVQRLVHIAEGLMLRARASGHHLHFSEFSTWMMAGPRSTTHSTGKMHPTIGKTIREDACAARSCAPCRWRRRISVAWTRSNLAIGTPIWSDCTIDEVMQVGYARCIGHVLERRHARPAEPDLAKHLSDLIAESVMETLRDAEKPFVETHA